MKTSYHDYLRKLPLFADLDADELKLVAGVATDLVFGPGKVLMKEGEVAHEMLVVVEGTLEVTRGSEHVADIGPGGFAGEMALLTRARRNSTVATKTDVALIHIDGRSFSILLQQVPQIAVKMLPVVAGRVTDRSDHHSH